MALVVWQPTLITELHVTDSMTDIFLGPPIKLHHEGKGTGALLCKRRFTLKLEMSTNSRILLDSHVGRHECYAVTHRFDLMLTMFALLMTNITMC